MALVPQPDQIGRKIFSLIIGVAVVYLLQICNVRRFLASWVSRLRLRLHIDRKKNERAIDSSHGMDAVCTPSITLLCIYPVKSLRAVSLEEATIDSLGFVGDRRFMLVTPSPPRSFGPKDATHRFLTQRQCPSLATITALQKGNALELSISDTHTTSATATVSNIPKHSIIVDVSPKLAIEKKSKVYRAGIWDDVVEVVDVGNEAASFVQSVIADTDDTWLNQKYKGVRLVSMPSSSSGRLTSDKYIPPPARTWTGGTPRTAFTDGFPLLVACEASLEEVNRRLRQKGKPSIPMSRFRPNIVIKNTVPFEEDNWQAILIGDHTILHLVKGCPRCKQSCTDQQTGKVSNEPLATLADFRALGRLGKKGGDVYFAQNAVAQSSGTTIRVGDSVVILTRGNPVWDMDAVSAE